jgi:hypothetical protein
MLPYLKEAGRFLGHIDEARIEQRGDPLTRFATTFEVSNTFKSIGFKRS